MNRVVFDIETLGYPLESFDETQQEYLMKFAHTDEERADAILKLNLTPFTARILAIGMLNPDSNQGKVYYHVPPEAAVEGPILVDDGLVELVPLDEATILQEFWKTITHYGQFITFNGRSFDCPFVMLRSALLGIKPTRNLLPYRYSANEHCDLLEQLSYYGAFRKFNLDFYCKAFNIRSPKSEGVTGLDMGRLFAEGRYSDIANYCLGDVKATADLFRRWLSMLAF
jgi:DNA polymerase elongation subunit (family B)